MSDIQKIEKLVRLTQSDNDHEALLALRNAQRLADGDLIRVLRGSEPTRSQPIHHQHRTDDDSKMEKDRRFLELLRRIRMKDATIAQLEREIAKLKAELNKPH
jgi:uncharacterized small protein (DUF1192 family)